jgi:PAS domain S-box-containing protein
MLSDYLTFLSETASALLTADDPQKFLKMLFRRLSELLRLEVYVHYSLAEDGNHLHLTSCQGIPPEACAGIETLALGEAVCGLVAQRQERIVISNVQQRQDAMTAFIRQFGISAYACHPLLAHGRLMGTLSFGTRYETAFGDDALALLDIVSNYVASALERKQSEDSLLEAVARTTRDINERADVDAARAHLAALVNSSNDAIVGKTPDGIITSWNAGAERLFGYSAEEAIGQSIYFIIPADRQKEEPAILDRVRQGERVENYDTVRQRKNGSLVDISLSVSPIIDEQGRVIGVSKVARDITERKRTELQLKELTAHLEERVSERTSALSHSREKLRSLAAELTVTEERERRKIAEELHDHLAQLLVLGRMKLSHAIRQVTNPGVAGLLHDLDGVISQCMTYTRSLVVKLTPPVLHELGLLPALQWLATWMHDQGLIVSLHLSKRPPVLTEAQAILLFQSVRELLFNVLKHASTRRASISVEEDAQGAVHVTVADEGGGFRVSELENGVDSHSRFGLFSIKERIESLHGRMEIYSTPGHGTRVTLVVQSVPSSAMGAAEVASVVPPVVRRLRVLLVDDHAMVREGLRSILESYTDLEVVGEAGDGIEAIKLVRSRQPEVVVMDINMPRMDGIAATRKIKREFPSTAVIGISVQESAHAEQAMLSAGASKFLTKDRAVGHLHEAILHTR